MRQETRTLYTFNELSDEAKQRAIESYRSKTYNEGIFWHEQSELFDSLKGLFDACPSVKMLDYSLSDESYRSYIKLGFQNDYDEAVYNLSGKRALAWLENNLLHSLRITRREYLKNRKNYLYYGSSYRIGKIKPGSFTGYFADDVFIEHLQQELKEGTCLGDAFKSLADKYANLLSAAIEYETSDDCISENLSDSFYEFTQEGVEV